MKHWHKEPLLHFLIIGAVIFVVFSIVNKDEIDVSGNKIVVFAAKIERLSANWSKKWNRPPTETELKGLVDSYIKEEIYYREALALGLERGDTIIRRRLQQKMEFLTDSGAEFLEPDAGELEAYYRANQQTFQDAPHIALEQIFLGQNPALERISADLVTLQSDAETDPISLGERTLLPSQMAVSTPTAIDSVFGTGFFDELAQLPTDVWAGPVESGYGAHLVRISDHVPARVPPLAEVRDAVLREWRLEKAAELREQVYARLRVRYDVVFPDAAATNNP